MRSLRLAALAFVLTCVVLNSAYAQKRKTSTTKRKPVVEIPANRASVDPTADADSELPIVVQLLADNSIRLRNTSITAEKLSDEIVRMTSAKFPSERIVFIKANAAVEYRRIVETVKIGRIAENDDFGLIVLKSDDDAANVDQALKIKTPLETVAKVDYNSNPLALIVALASDGKITLNSKPETLESLATKLQGVFASRKRNRVFIQGSRLTEKTVFVKASLSAKFGEVAKVIELLKNVGADPIGLQIDELPQ